MSYIYHLAGENLELAEAELRGFLKSQEANPSISRSGRLAETEAEPTQLKRLALTHEVCRKITENDIENIENQDLDYKPETKYAVRVENISEKERDKEFIEEVIGEKLNSKENCVDLENPDVVVKAYLLDEKIVVGQVIESIDRGLYNKRKNQYRPFSSPISLDPILARVLVNLSGIKPGKTVLDPFCGTGGILIEAGLCGVQIKGLDIKEEMCKGCVQNLEEYGIINHDIRQGEISEINQVFDKRFDAIITDLPYGKSSKQTEDAVDSFLNLIEDFQGKAVFIWNEESIGNYKADFSVYVHGSLSRHIFIV